MNKKLNNCENWSERIKGKRFYKNFKYKMIQTWVIKI